MITFNRFSTYSVTATGDDLFPCPASSGNLLVASIVCDGAITITEIGDSKGNDWTLLGPVNSDVGAAYLAYSLSASSGVTDLEIISSGADGSSGISVGLYDNNSLTGGLFDVYAVSALSYGGTPQGSLSPTSGGIVVASLSLGAAASSVDSPFTFEPISNAALINPAATACYLNPAAGFVTASFPVSGPPIYWSSIIASFKEGSIPTTATPTYMPPAGTYGAPQSVAISCATSGSTITYTLDGSTPVPGSHGSVYSTPISVSTSLTIKAVASAPGYLNSAEADAAYVISAMTANPTFAPPPGMYGPAQSVTLTCATPASTITYTIDGSTPVPGSHGSVYGGPITVATTTTIKAIGSAPGYTNSAVVTGTYVIEGAAATPILAPGTGVYATAQTVTITCATPASTITYTTDGSTPVPGSHGAVYTVPITVSVSETVKAVASAGGYLNSAVASAMYTIGNPEVFVAEVQITITYQNPGNYLYARDLNSWGDGGAYGANNGTPYPEANIVIGSITLSPLGGEALPLEHVCIYCDAVGTGDFGGPSVPELWVMPNEISDTAGIGFVQLPEVLQEPPIGQTWPSKSIQALRFPVNMANSALMSQLVHSVQVKIRFEPENAPNCVKGLSFKSDQTV